MMKASALALLCLATALSPAAFAAPAKKAPAAKAAAPAGGQTKEEKAVADAAAAPVSTQTDVIGSKEAPGVFNIVPWKDKGVEIPKREVNTSILRETLQPLDRDVLRREIQLQQALGKE